MIGNERDNNDCDPDPSEGAHISQAKVGCESILDSTSGRRIHPLMSWINCAAPGGRNEAVDFVELLAARP